MTAGTFGVKRETQHYLNGYRQPLRALLLIWHFIRTVIFASFLIVTATTILILLLLSGWWMTNEMRRSAERDNVDYLHTHFARASPLAYPAYLAAYTATVTTAISGQNYQVFVYVSVCLLILSLGSGAARCNGRQLLSAFVREGRNARFSLLLAAAHRRSWQAYICNLLVTKFLPLSVEPTV